MTTGKQNKDKEPGQVMRLAALDRAVQEGYQMRGLFGTLVRDFARYPFGGCGDDDMTLELCALPKKLRPSESNQE